MYVCKVCKKEAQLVNRVIVKSCKCEGGVIMDMGNVTLKSFGKLKEKRTAKDTAMALLNQIVKKLKEIRGEI